MDGLCIFNRTRFRILFRLLLSSTSIRKKFEPALMTENTIWQKQNECIVKNVKLVYIISQLLDFAYI